MVTFIINNGSFKKKVLKYGTPRPRMSRQPEGSGSWCWQPLPGCASPAAAWEASFVSSVFCRVGLGLGFRGLGFRV